MKNLMFFSLFAVILFMTSCTQQADVNTILENAETKDKVFSAILGDHELMTEFMNKMMSNEHAMMMMQGNEDMMGMMMKGGDMMQMMKDKPEMMHNMMNGMMHDGNMMAHMMQMMNQEGMMSDECLQSCTQMMTDKGMSMEMGMMGSESKGQEDGSESHDSHH